MNYSPEHDSGNEPCTEGRCCLPRREYVAAKLALQNWDGSPECQRYLVGAMTGEDERPKSVYQMLYLLQQPFSTLNLSHFCELVGISYTTLVVLRKKYADLSELCRAYLAGVAEHEFQTGERGMASTPLNLALSRLVPEFKESQENALSEDDILRIVTTAAESIRTRISSLDIPEAQREALILGLAQDLIHAFALVK